MLREVSKSIVFSGPYFPAFRPNTDQKNSVFGNFSRSVMRSELICNDFCFFFFASNPVFHSNLKKFWRNPKKSGKLLPLFVGENMGDL